jgi:hypothetical protein
MILTVMSLAGTSAVAADEPIVDWSGSGVGVWHEDESGNWVDLPFEAPQVQKAYKYEMLCIRNNQNDVDAACIARANCDAGKDGRPVRWYERFLNGSPDAWSPMRPDRCIYSEDPSDVLGRIAAQIQRRFEQLPVDAGTLGIQPRPHTLRGADTNFYAESSQQSFDVTMLGQKVHITAKPVQYRWDYGDGISLGPRPPRAARSRRTAGVRRPGPATPTQRPATSASSSPPTSREPTPSTAGRIFPSQIRANSALQPRR